VRLDTFLGNRRYAAQANQSLQTIILCDLIGI
jgi:hypothetical protein